MKKFSQQFGLAILIAAVMAGCTSPPPTTARPTVAARNGKAIVRSQHGNITFSTNGTFKRLRVNMELTAGTIIKTDAGSEAYLQVNGFTSTIKITENSILELTKMEQRRTLAGWDSETVLTVKMGKILSSVRKLSANSSYVIHTPKGVASIRGTDFEIAADLLPDGTYRVTFTSITGQVSVTAMVDGQEKTQNLTTGQSWTPGEGDPKSAPPPPIVGDYLPAGVRLIPVISTSGPLSPPTVIQPFNGAGPPNTAVDMGRNPYIRVSQPPPPHH